MRGRRACTRCSPSHPRRTTGSGALAADDGGGCGREDVRVACSTRLRCARCTQALRGWRNSRALRLSRSGQRRGVSSGLAHLKRHRQSPRVTCLGPHCCGAKAQLFCGVPCTGGCGPCTSPSQRLTQSPWRGAQAQLCSEERMDKPLDAARAHPPPSPNRSPSSRDGLAAEVVAPAQLRRGSPPTVARINTRGVLHRSAWRSWVYSVFLAH